MKKNVIPGNKIISIICIGFLILEGNSLLHAQNKSGDNGKKLTWVNAGIGGSGMSAHPYSDGNMSFGASISHQNGKHIYTIHCIQNSEFYLGNLLDDDPSPSQDALDIAVLYGRNLFKSNFVAASLSVGCSYVHGKIRGKQISPDELEYEAITFTTLGIPLEAQIYFTFFSFLGIGATGYANINAKASIAGIFFGLQIGRLR